MCLCLLYAYINKDCVVSINIPILLHGHFLKATFLLWISCYLTNFVILA